MIFIAISGREVQVLILELRLDMIALQLSISTKLLVLDKKLTPICPRNGPRPIRLHRTDFST